MRKLIISGFLFVTHEATFFLAKSSFMFWPITNVQVIFNIDMSVFVMVCNGPTLMQMN